VILSVALVLGVAAGAAALGYRSERVTARTRLVLFAVTAALVGLVLLQYYRDTPQATIAARVEPRPAAPGPGTVPAPLARAMIDDSADLRSLAPLAGALALGLITIGLTRPRWGLYSLIVLTTLADEFVIEFSPWTLQLGLVMFQHWWKFLSPAGTRQLGFLIVNNLDVGLAAIALGLATRAVAGRPPRLRTPAELPFMLALVLVLGWMFVYGVASGGDLKPALWQVRGLFYLLALAALTPQFIETRDQIRTVIWAFVVPITFKALQIDWRYFVDRGGQLGDLRSMIGHEDSGLIVGAVTLGVALALYGVERAQCRFLLASLPVLLLGLAFNVRRASYAVLALSLGAMPVLLHTRRRAALRAAVAVLALVALYGAVSWNRPHDPVALPLQKAKSLFVPVQGGYDASSNRYRRDEDINLRMTILRHPAGLGFGQRFELHVPLDDIEHLYKQWQYNPHNTILGLWISLGTAGIVVFLAYVGSLILLAAHGVRRQDDLYLKAVSYLVLTSVTGGLLIGLTDLYIGTTRSAVFLGVLTGLLASVQHLEPVRPGASSGPSTLG
jgi:O-antigen ligase/polysaccharide polymerase Wzy-like membrane protein